MCVSLLQNFGPRSPVQYANARVEAALNCQVGGLEVVRKLTRRRRVAEESIAVFVSRVLTGVYCVMTIPTQALESMSN